MTLRKVYTLRNYKLFVGGNFSFLKNLQSKTQTSTENTWYRCWILSPDRYARKAYDLVFTLNGPENKMPATHTTGNDSGSI